MQNFLWRKPKKKEEVELDAESLGALGALFKGSKIEAECPKVLALSKLCACIDCPNKDKPCKLEALCKAVGCKNFIRSCSLKNAITAEEGKEPRNSKFAEVVWEGFEEHLMQELANEEPKKKEEKRGSVSGVDLSSKQANIT